MCSFSLTYKYNCVIFIAWGDFMKKKIIIFSSIGAAIVILVTVLLVCLLLAKVDKSYRSIKVFKVQGRVNIKRNNNVTLASAEMKLKNNDVVEVLEGASTVLKLDNDKFVMAKENTTLRLVATGKENNTKTRILVDKGGVVVEVKEKLKDNESFEIASSNSVMAIRGTQISFEVEVKDNKITTSFAILEGETEVLLYKNETLSSTKLSKDFRMSYTTDIEDAADIKEIAKLIDKIAPIVINDSELNEVFKVVKEGLTSEEIDNIVDNINNFERDEEKDKVNGVIKFEFSSNPEYGVDPKTLIEVEESYKDIEGLEYYYSKTVDGEYKIFNTESPLDAGEWYCKLEAGNAYRSDPLKFTIDPIEIKINAMAAVVKYKDDPKESITTKNEPEGSIYKYSKEVDGTYAEFDSENPLELGTWYLMIDGGSNYTFTPTSFSVIEVELHFKLSENPTYGMDPKELLEIIGDVVELDSVTCLYSRTQNGTYAEFDSENPLGAGEWYMMIDAGLAYKSNPQKITIEPKEIELEETSESIEYKTDPQTIILSKDELISPVYSYSKTIDGEYTEYDSNAPLDAGEWYLNIDGGSNYTFTPIKITIDPKEISIELPEEIPYGTNLIELLDLDSELGDFDILYSSEEVTEEYITYTGEEEIELGIWYLKIDHNSNYKSDIVQFEIVQKELNLSINLGQTIHAMSATSADVVISIADDEFFNSDAAKELDENMQPVNYIVCKARYYDTDNTEKYYWGELNYRNKEVVFDRSIFAANYVRNDAKPTIEFEYHVDEKYSVTNPLSQQYEFVDEFNINNIVVYYDYITGDYYMQVERGAYTTRTDIDPEYFSEYLCAFFSDSITDRADFFDATGQVYEFDLTEYGTEVDGVYNMTIKAVVGSGDYFGEVVYSKEVSVDTNVFEGKLDNLPTGFSRPYMNIGAYFYTFNNDGTINVYVDLQNGIDMYEDRDELALGDYLVRYNINGSTGPDTYVRGNGRFLVLENIAYADYVIKDVFAVCEVKDGITYALAHEENDKYIDILANDIEINDASQGDYGIENSISINPTTFAGDKIIVIDSLGNETEYDNEIFDLNGFSSDVYSVTIKTNRQITMYAEDYESLINDTDYTDENRIALDETNFTYLKAYMLEHHNIEVKGFTEGEFGFKVYFEVTGEYL